MSSWKINPLLFEGYRDNAYKGIEDLFEVAETNSEELKEISGDREEPEQQGVYAVSRGRPKVKMFYSSRPQREIRAAHPCFLERTTCNVG